MSKLFRVSLSCIQSCQRLASKKVMKSPKFSESKAYQGVDKFIMNEKHNNQLADASYYDSRSYRNTVLLSFLFSELVLCIYLVFLRGENEFDKIFSTPVYVLSSNFERSTIRHNINKARANGEDTKLLEESLAYVDIKEAAAKARFEKLK
uniref:Uncharacterized protein n=1 Tax=Strongyloides venezuelensis TaxID=75913 RepID=A0A0K0FVG7_STRVS